MEKIELALQSALQSPFFGIVLSIAAYNAGRWVNRTLKTPVANPLLIAMFLVVAFVRFFEFPVEDYERGGDLLLLMLVPATCVLGVSIYHKRQLLKERFLPICAGCFAGALVSMISTFLLCRLFGLSELLRLSLMPKSVTTPIAVELAQQVGGIPALAVAAVIFTGIFGNIIAPWLIKFFKAEDPVIAGIALGTASHAVGTAKAIELGETEGAIAGIAIGLTGLFTVFLFLWL